MVIVIEFKQLRHSVGSSSSGVFVFRPLPAVEHGQEETQNENESIELAMHNLFHLK